MCRRTDCRSADGRYRTAATSTYSPLPRKEVNSRRVALRFPQRHGRTMKRRTLLSAGPGALFLAPHLQISAAAAAEPDRAKELYGLLGKLPPRDRKVGAQLVSTEDRGTYTLEKLVLDLNGIEAAPAYFAKPKDKAGRLPTVLFNHSHGGGYQSGKTEFIAGREYLANPPY